MAHANSTTLAWQVFNPADLSPEHRNAYEAYKAAYKATQELRKAFETGMNTAAGLPDGKALVFGYRFGKLSIAVGDAAAPAAATAKPKASLSDWLKAQR